MGHEPDLSFAVEPGPAALGSPSARVAAGHEPHAARGLYLPEPDFRYLFVRFGPSLGLWRAAEVAALREQQASFEHPVLDLGCGDGLVTSLVLPRVAIGVDPDGRALAKAAALGAYERLRPVTIEDAQLPAGSMATILSNSVLEHVLQLDRALAAAARVLRPGGRLIFTVPTDAFGSWLLLPSDGYAAWRNHQLAHLNLWPIERWNEHLARAGLQIELVRPYLRRGLVRAWDALELLQQVRLGRWRAFGWFWRRLPAAVITALARRVARLDLAAPAPGGGRLLVARKVGP